MANMGASTLRPRQGGEHADPSRAWLRMENIRKEFPGVVAVQDVTLSVRPREIVGLVGENGAGKSTLMRILAGFHRPDRGRILLDGAEVNIGTPAEGMRIGISMVYQEPKLAPNLTLAENVWLGNEPVGFGGRIRHTELIGRTHAIISRFGMRIDPNALVGDLSIPERQVAEIAKALSNESRIVIFDEPTAPLDPSETERLFDIIEQLRDEGKSIIYITHRLYEVRQITDRIVVMKDGRIAGELPTTEASDDRIVHLMVGRQVKQLFPPRPAQAPRPEYGKGLEIEGLTLGRVFRDIHLQVSPGEIVGLAGIEGSGQRPLARAIAGIIRPTGGTVRLDGRVVAPRTPGEASELGIVYLSNDRRHEGLMMPLSVGQNLALPNLSRWVRWSLLDRRLERQEIKRTVETFFIRTASPEEPVENLSGGNQQKVVLGKWFLTSPRVLIVDEPTQGVDVASKAEIYRLLRQMAEEGACVLVLSSDHLELIGVCDRICVVSDGRCVAEIPAESATEESIIRAAVTYRASDAPSSHGPESKEASPPGARRSKRRSGSVPVVGGVLALLVAVAATQSPYFLSPFNIGSLISQSIPLALASLGQMAVLLLAGVDLSVGATMSLMTVLASFFLTGDSPASWVTGVLLCLGTGAAIGLLNAIVIRWFRIPDLIATLATLSIVQGVAYLLRPGPGGLISFRFSDLVQYQIGWFPLATLPVLAFVVLAEVWLVKTRGGLRMYATGANQEAAYISGIPTTHLRTWAYVSCGLLAAAAGLFLATRIGSGDPNAGNAYTLTSVTAAVVGGTSIFGGKGTVTGTVLGVLLLTVMTNLLNLVQVSSYYQYVWTGVLTIAAVGVYSFRERSR